VWHCHPPPWRANSAGGSSQSHGHRGVEPAVSWPFAQDGSARSGEVRFRRAASLVDRRHPKDTFPLHRRGRGRVQMIFGFRSMAWPMSIAGQTGVLPSGVSAATGRLIMASIRRRRGALPPPHGWLCASFGTVTVHDHVLCVTTDWRHSVSAVGLFGSHNNRSPGRIDQINGARTAVKIWPPGSLTAVSHERTVELDLRRCRTQRTNLAHLWTAKVCSRRLSGQYSWRKMED
jgi:hypothetical protein